MNITFLEKQSNKTKNDFIIWHLTKNELLIGLTISVILTLFANFALLMRRYDLIMDSKASGITWEIEKYDFWFSIVWFWLFSFILFILYRWMYKWGNIIFRRKEVKTIGFAIGIIVFVAFGLYQAYPALKKIIIMEKKHDAITSYNFTEHAVFITEVSKKTLDMAPDSISSPNKAQMGVSAVFSSTNSYPLLVEHIFVLLTIMLSMLLLHLLDKKQEMTLEYEKIKVEKLQNSYNALMGQINPHFFFNSLNGLNSLIRMNEQDKTLEYLEGLSNVFRYILQSNHKTLVTLDEELQFAKAYTYLLSVRYENKLFFSIRIAEGCRQKRLPILSLLPLIENAVKHNIISMQHPLQVEVYTTSEDLLAVSNPIRPKKEECICNKIGLKNLQGRYQMLTGKSIRINNSNGYFVVSLPLSDILE
nr:sensor histidine kinase [Bacteroides cellulosilyticus]